MTEVLIRRVAIASAAFLLTVGIFAYGLAIGTYGIWPFYFLQTVHTAAQSLIEFGEFIPKGRRVRAPEYASRQTFTIHDPDLMVEGYYVFLGWNTQDWRYSAWLYDGKGKNLHTWSWDYTDLDSDGPLNGGDTPHGFKVLSDGSVVVNFDHGDVMVRLDACSQPIWTKPGIYHHSLALGEDGSFWVWRAEGSPYGHYHYMENFDAETGEMLREVALVEDIIKNMGSSAIRFGVRTDFNFLRIDKTPVSKADRNMMDIFHPNDIDILHSDIAHMFPMFEAGDLLISLKRLNLVAIIDPDDHRVKWMSHGPWLLQHDPDFTADGKISVFNNNIFRGRSEIIKMDPATREISNDLIEGEAMFYSHNMGKHQYLPNGNVLIVVPQEGRVIEVTAAGKYVMEFNNISPSSLEYNEHIENGVWVPLDYFQTFPQCSK